jgi:hypothetical protein
MKGASHLVSAKADYIESFEQAFSKNKNNLITYQEQTKLQCTLQHQLELLLNPVPQIWTVQNQRSCKYCCKKLYSFKLIFGCHYPNCNSDTPLRYISMVLSDYSLQQHSTMPVLSACLDAKKVKVP